MYLSGRSSDTLSVIDTNGIVLLGSPIQIEDSLVGIAFDSTHDRIYVANFDSDNVSVIDTNTNTVVGLPLVVGASSLAIAFVPPQP
jgi:DNA-binding beta-propeller fold protein YncE